jgi:hypothetical protein
MDAPAHATGAIPASNPLLPLTLPLNDVFSYTVRILSQLELGQRCPSRPLPKNSVKSDSAVTTVLLCGDVSVWWRVALDTGLP